MSGELEKKRTCRVSIERTKRKRKKKVSRVNDRHRYMYRVLFRIRHSNPSRREFSEESLGYLAKSEKPRRVAVRR